MAANIQGKVVPLGLLTALFQTGASIRKRGR